MVRRRRRKREEKGRKKLRERRVIKADSSYQVMERADGLKGIKEIKVLLDGYWGVSKKIALKNS